MKLYFHERRIVPWESITVIEAGPGPGDPNVSARSFWCVTMRIRPQLGCTTEIVWVPSRTMIPGARVDGVGAAVELASMLP